MSILEKVLHEDKLWDVYSMTQKSDIHEVYLEVVEEHEEALADPDSISDIDIGVLLGVRNLLCGLLEEK